MPCHGGEEIDWKLPKDKNTESWRRKNIRKQKQLNRKNKKR